jgi:tRNA C32,U32 (ribose-2'-O)-methylase TrmJ
MIFLATSLVAGECEDLMSKYHAPNPATKTMKQLKRWVKRKVKDDNKDKILKCLIDRAADNPNKATVAGG